ncbi:F-type H+-transporting ATPase subunit delta [Acetitomaculum ruminis DSM 5522]|uniref:ATP synthase subunit delta n=1 Tax=Acetitomaculum ruminis DSM 5522 TaxID=1120918 RepID=A0A1I0YRB7_9FIRM|nr:ATP synthase F1 subunit delta [Acetitomaculum ruminis]SFB15864.1 F-type H+-transporting ATPase subunit delta [Acetitomaculum ruminis DSM 5522]
MAKLVSTTYGDALFELALDENQLDALYEEVTAVVQALEDNPELIKLLNHPNIDKEEKIKVVENVFEGRVSKYLIGLIDIVVEKEHSAEIVDILNYFVAMYKEHKKIGIAYVTTAVELRAEQKESLVKKLLDTTSYVKFEVHYKVDETLIGGMIIRINDKVVDSSIRTKLYELTQKLSDIRLVS